MNLSPEIRNKHKRQREQWQLSEIEDSWPSYLCFRFDAYDRTSTSIRSIWWHWGELMCVRYVLVSSCVSLSNMFIMTIRNIPWICKGKILSIKSKSFFYFHFILRFYSLIITQIMRNGEKDEYHAVICHFTWFLNLMHHFVKCVFFCFRVVTYKGYAM